MKVSNSLKKCTIMVGDAFDKSKEYISDATIVLNDSSSTVLEKQHAEKRIKYWTKTGRVSFSLEAA